MSIVEDMNDPFQIQRQKTKLTEKQGLLFKRTVHIQEKPTLISKKTNLIASQESSLYNSNFEVQDQTQQKTMSAGSENESQGLQTSSEDEETDKISDS